METKSLMRDEWLWIFAGATLLCATLSVMNHFPLGRGFSGSPTARPSVATKAENVASTPTSAANVASVAPVLPAAQIAPAQATKPPVVRTLTAKIAGHWIVDEKSASDSDTTIISEAVANAIPGDQIIIRAGTYTDHLVISKNVTISGESSTAKPMILSIGANTIFVDGAEVTVSNLKIVHKPNAGEVHHPAFIVKNGMATIKNSEIVEVDPSAGSAMDACLAFDHAKGEVQAVTISGGYMGIAGLKESSVHVANSTFSNFNKIGFSMVQKSTGKIEHSTFTHMDIAINSELGAHADATDVHVTDGRLGFHVGPDSNGSLSDSDISGQKAAGVVAEGGTITVDNTKLTHNTYGVAAKGKGVLTVNHSQLLDNTKAPYFWTAADPVQFNGTGNNVNPAGK